VVFKIRWYLRSGSILSQVVFKIRWYLSRWVFETVYILIQRVFGVGSFNEIFDLGPLLNMFYNEGSFLYCGRIISSLYVMYRSFILA